MSAAPNHSRLELRPERQASDSERSAKPIRKHAGRTNPARVAPSATRRTYAHANQLRPPGLLLGGAMYADESFRAK